MALTLYASIDAGGHELDGVADGREPDGREVEVTRGFLQRLAPGARRGAVPSPGRPTTRTGRPSRPSRGRSMSTGSSSRPSPASSTGTPAQALDQLPRPHDVAAAGHRARRRSPALARMSAPRRFPQRPPQRRASRPRSCCRWSREGSGESSASERTAVVFGARHLGRGIAARLSGAGWRVLAAARTGRPSPPSPPSTPTCRPGPDLGAPGAAADRSSRPATSREPSTWSSTRSPTRRSLPRRFRARREEAPTSTPRSAPPSTPVHHVVEASVGSCGRRDMAVSFRSPEASPCGPSGDRALAATGYVTRALVEGAVPRPVRTASTCAPGDSGTIESDLTATSLGASPQTASMTDDDVTAAIEFLLAQSAGRLDPRARADAPAAPWGLGGSVLAEVAELAASGSQSLADLASRLHFSGE